MKLRIVSDGTRAGTRVEDEGGNVLENVKEIGWFVDERGMVTARIVVENVSIDAASTEVELIPKTPDD